MQILTSHKMTNIYWWPTQLRNKILCRTPTHYNIRKWWRQRKWRRQGTTIPPWSDQKSRSGRRNKRKKIFLTKPGRSRSAPASSRSEKVSQKSRSADRGWRCTGGRRIGRRIGQRRGRTWVAKRGLRAKIYLFQYSYWRIVWKRKMITKTEHIVLFPPNPIWRHDNGE